MFLKILAEFGNFTLLFCSDGSKECTKFYDARVVPLCCSLQPFCSATFSFEWKLVKLASYNHGTLLFVHQSHAVRTLECRQLWGVILAQLTERRWKDSPQSCSSWRPEIFETSSSVHRKARRFYSRLMSRLLSGKDYLTLYRGSFSFLTFSKA